MTFDDFLAVLAAVRADTHNRLDTGQGGRSFVRQFEMTDEDADKAVHFMSEGFRLTSMLMGLDVVAVNSFSIGVDMGKKLAEAEHMQSMLPKDSA